MGLVWLSVDRNADTAFPVKKDPKSFLLNWIFSSHSSRAVSARKPWNNLHSFIYCRDQFFTILRAQ